MVYHGGVQSDRDRNPAYDPANAVRKCMEGRRVVLYERRSGADRRLGTDRSDFSPDSGEGRWEEWVNRSKRRAYAEVRRKVGDGFVCRAARSRTVPPPSSVGVSALGAQTTTAAPDVVKYDTKLTIDFITDRGGIYLGLVKSDRDRNREYHPANAVRKCMEGRRVILFEQRPGADRRLGTARSHFKPRLGQGYWQHNLRRYRRAVYAKVTRKVGKRFVCRADRSGTKHVHVPGSAGT